MKRPKSVIIALVVLLLAGGELWAAGPFQPRGICSLSDTGQTPGIPEIPGRQALVQWADCNPAPGVYDFSNLEAEIASCMADGRKFCLIKLNGDNKPAWMTNVVPYLKGIQLTAEVNDPNTLMYWHPTFKQAYQDGCDRKCGSIFGPIGIPAMIGASSAQRDQRLGVGFFPPSS